MFILMTGFNDARLNGDSPFARRKYSDALEVMFRAFHAANPHASVLAIEQPYIEDYTGHEPFHKASDAVVDAYNATLSQAVSRHVFAQTVAIEGWEAESMTAADGVHPNDRGHAHIGKTVVHAVKAARNSAADGASVTNLGKRKLS